MALIEGHGGGRPVSYHYGNERHNRRFCLELSDSTVHVGTTRELIK